MYIIMKTMCPPGYHISYIYKYLQTTEKIFFSFYVRCHLAAFSNIYMLQIGCFKHFNFYLKI